MDEHEFSRLAVGRPMEILLVEDNLMDARVTIEALKGSSIKHRMTLVRDGQETIEFLKHEGRFAQAPAPDLILLDLNLPKKDGFAVLQELRADEALQHVAVVVLTASGAEHDRDRCEQFHVQNFIRKPVNLDKFLIVLKDLRRDWLHDVVLPSFD
ncbi:MAG: response regulator [Pirellulaceae bacterium]|nr:response regulator [Pirellulaceae bacterium]